MSQSLDEILDTPLTEEQLDGLRRLDAISEGDLQVMAIRAIREIIRLREVLLAAVKVSDEDRCPACDCPYATKEQRDRPGRESPLLCRRKLEGDVCANPPMDWRHRARKFEGALAMAVKHAGRYRADREALKEELRLIDVALSPLDRQPPLTRAEFLRAIVQEVQASRLSSGVTLRGARPSRRGRRR